MVNCDWSIVLAVFRLGLVSSQWYAAISVLTDLHCTSVQVSLLYTRFQFQANSNCVGSRALTQNVNTAVTIFVWHGEYVSNCQICSKFVSFGKFLLHWKCLWLCLLEYAALFLFFYYWQWTNELFTLLPTHVNHLTCDVTETIDMTYLHPWPDTVTVLTHREIKCCCIFC